MKPFGKEEQAFLPLYVNVFKRPSTFGLTKHWNHYVVKDNNLALMHFLAQLSTNCLDVGYCDCAVSVMHCPSSTFYLVYALEATFLVWYS